jgi:hypothetical protein
MSRRFLFKFSILTALTRASLHWIIRADGVAHVCVCWDADLGGLDVNTLVPQRPGCAIEASPLLLHLLVCQPVWGNIWIETRFHFPEMGHSCEIFSSPILLPNGSVFMFLLKWCC